MKFLLPVGGQTDKRFGILTSPAHLGVVSGIKAGLPWAADNGAFTKSFDRDKFLSWLWAMTPYRETCLFVAVPDVVADAPATIKRFAEYAPLMRDWPLAFVAQDGQENLEFPMTEDFTDWCYGKDIDPDDDTAYYEAQQQWERECCAFDVLFIGGSTAWKTSAGAVACIKEAQRLGRRIHIGRVNWGKRYQFFRTLHGSEDFTCDGTRTRFDGVERTINGWAGYMAQPPLVTV